MSKKRILIAENSRDFAELMVQYFSKQPNTEIVGVAYNGNQALTMIKQTRPDVLLLDLIMPEMDGLEVIKQINQNYKDLQICVISAVSNEEVIDIVHEYGVKEYFVKPIRFSEVQNAICKT